MTDFDQSLSHFREKAYWFACKRKRRDVAEDFAQEATIRYAKIYPVRPNMGFVWADYFRATEGRSGTDLKQFRVAEQLHEELDARNMPEHINSVYQMENKSLIEHIGKLSFVPALPHHRILRAIVLLRYKWEFTVEEIAEMFGMSQRTVMIYSKEALDLIKRGLICDGF